MEKHAIVHVENTQNLIDFAEFLNISGYKIISANKTEQILEKNKIPVIHEQALEEGSFYTMGASGLIKRILQTRADKDSYQYDSDMQDNNIFIICINMIPILDTTIQSRKTSLAMFGKPQNFFVTTLLRNSFCNYENLLILTDPADYKEAVIQLKTDNIKDDFRLYLAAKALNLVAAFDGGLATSVLHGKLFDQKFMNYLTIPFRKEMELHQGANQQQKANLYRTPVDFGALNGFSKLNGKELSYTMAADATFAWEQINSLYSILKNQYTVNSENKDGYPFTTQFTPIAGTVFTIAVKMNNVLGAALSSNILNSFKKTYTYDTENITDVTLGCSAVVDEKAAAEIVKCSFSVIIAPGFTPEAKDILAQNKNLKLIASGKSNDISVDGKLINGGILLQERDVNLFKKWRIRTTLRPSQIITDQMAFGTRVAMGARSYSAILIKDNSIKGIAQGALSTVEALEFVLADVHKRNERTHTQSQEDQNIADVLVCDSPIPFCEEIKKLIEGGISAIIQPGGAVTDQNFCDYCEERNVVMVFTDMTHINF